MKRTFARTRASSSLAALAPLIVTLVVAPGVALAHDPPHVSRVVMQGGGSRVFVTNRGLVLAPQDASLRLLCNEALGISTTEVAELAAMPDGKLLIATSRGAAWWTRDACSVQNVAGLEESTPALAQDANDPRHLVIATYGTEHSALHASWDAGASWNELTRTGADTYFEEVRIAADDASVLYASGSSFPADAPVEHFIDRSDDHGARFERFTVALEDGESDYVLLAVDPEDALGIVGFALGTELTTRADRLLISRDGGETHESPLTAHGITAAAFAGGALWVSGLDGLFRSSDSGRRFERVGNAERMSLVQRADDERNGVLVAGRYNPNENGVARLDPSGAPSESLLRFTDVTLPVACAGETTQPSNACSFAWSEWRFEVLGVDVNGTYADAGVDDGGLSASDSGDAEIGAEEVGTRPSNRSDEGAGSGCSIASAGRARTRLGAGLLWLLPVASAVLRRRRALTRLFGNMPSSSAAGGPPACR